MTLLILALALAASVEDESGSGEDLDFTLNETNTTGHTSEDDTWPGASVGAGAVLGVVLIGSLLMHKCRPTSKVHDTCLQECCGFDCWESLFGLISGWISCIRSLSGSEKAGGPDDDPGLEARATMQTQSAC